jgi:hypothetical protein
MSKKTEQTEIIEEPKASSIKPSSNEQKDSVIYSLDGGKKTTTTNKAIHSL